MLYEVLCNNILHNITLQQKFRTTVNLSELLGHYALMCTSQSKGLEPQLQGKQLGKFNYGLCVNKVQWSLYLTGTLGPA